MISPSSKKSLESLAFGIVAVVCLLSWYFYRPQIINFWHYGVESSEELSLNSWAWLENNFEKIFALVDSPVVSDNSPDTTLTENKVSIKDCGATLVPDLKSPIVYKDDAVLACLGNSALYCEDARAVLNSALFPSIFEVTNDKNICNFRLSYAQDSALVDVTGKKLANQYISCPVGIVKAVDESKNIPVFTSPNSDNMSTYASQIYFYGVIGVFAENNLDKNKIQSLGCSGSYIDSVVASYNKKQEKK